MELVSLMPPDLGITVFTYSLSVAMRLSDHPKIDVIVLGGKLMKNALVTSGSDMIKYISEIRADACFLSASGIDLDTGLMEIDWDVCQFKKAILEASDRSVIMSTKEKIGTKQRFLVSPLNNIHTLITEESPDHPDLLAYKKRGLQLL